MIHIDEKSNNTYKLLVEGDNLREVIATPGNKKLLVNFHCHGSVVKEKDQAEPKILFLNSNWTFIVLNLPNTKRTLGRNKKKQKKTVNQFQYPGTENHMKLKLLN